MPDERPGATYLQTGAGRFTVWAPRQPRVWVHLVAPEDRLVEMVPAGRGYHDQLIEGLRPGARYFYRFEDGTELGDPASRFQPEGPEGPSEIIDPYTFRWEDAAWRGIPLERYVIAGVDVAGFSEEGTFRAAAAHLDGLVELGVTAVELLDGEDAPAGGWGFPGAFPCAVQGGPGGPNGLKTMVNECHRRKLAVILSVDYSRLAEGQNLDQFAPYASSSYTTSYGQALNFDGPGSDEVRRFFILNALSWLEDFHFDALHLRKVDAIVDTSPRPFLAHLADEVADLSGAFGRQYHLIADSSLNDARLVATREVNGLGLDAQWSQDFQLALAALITGDRTGFLSEFGSPDDFAAALAQGFVFTGQYSSHHQRAHGVPSSSVPHYRFVVGSSAPEDAPAGLDAEQRKLAAAAVLSSANIPFLRAGEEGSSTLRGLYRELIRLRSELRPPAFLLDQDLEAWSQGQAVFFLRSSAPDASLAIFNFGDEPFTGAAELPDEHADGPWHRHLDSAEERFGGPGSSLPAVLDGAGALSISPRSFVWLSRQPA